MRLPQLSKPRTGACKERALEVLRSGDKRLKGLKPVEHYNDRGTVKYTYGSYQSMSEANAQLKTVKKKFPDAFVIKTCNGKRIK